MQKMNMFHFKQEHNNIMNCASEQQVVHQSQCMNCCFSEHASCQWDQACGACGVISAEHWETSLNNQSVAPTETPFRTSENKAKLLHSPLSHHMLTSSIPTSSWPDSGAANLNGIHHKGGGREKKLWTMYS